MRGLLSGFWAIFASAAGTLLGAAQTTPSAAEGLMGSSLAAAQKTDFFTFFNFAPVGEEKSPAGGSITSFKPTGDDFKALVTLRVTTDTKGIIRRLDLEIARSFIDDPKKCIYAADLAKSYLGAAAVVSSGDDVDALAQEISARAMAGMTTTMLTSQPLPKPPATPSAAYMTYAGAAQPQTLTYPSGKTQVTLRNEIQAGQTVLSMVVSSKSGT